MSSQFTAIYDACVLYPAPLRSLLMYLALTDIFRARWTNDIHEEWMRNVCKNYPDISRAQVENIRNLMNSHVRDCLVTGYEFLGALERQGLAQTVSSLRQFAALI